MEVKSTYIKKKIPFLKYFLFINFFFKKKKLVLTEMILLLKAIPNTLEMNF